MYELSKFAAKVNISFVWTDEAEWRKPVGQIDGLANNMLS